MVQLTEEEHLNRLDFAAEALRFAYLAPHLLARKTSMRFQSPHIASVAQRRRRVGVKPLHFSMRPIFRTAAIEHTPRCTHYSFRQCHSSMPALHELCPAGPGAKCGIRSCPLPASARDRGWARPSAFSWRFQSERYRRGLAADERRCASHYEHD